MNPRYPAVSRRAEHRCEYCHAPEAISNFAFEVEHVIPQAQGGTDDEGNLALACRACNLYKSDALDGLDPETGQAADLFHPRRHPWQEHFRFDEETGSLLGLTPTGRATVARLQMNTPFQAAARLIWIRLGIYP